MNKGLLVTEKEIVFGKRQLKEIPYSCITDSFKVNIEDVRLIVLSPRLAMDEEVIIITLIDKHRNFHQFSSYEFKEEGVKELETKFGLKSIQRVEWAKFSWEEQENMITDKIIYPEKLYWKDLFVKPRYLKKFFVQILKFFNPRQIVTGKLCPVVVEYLQDKKE